MEYDYWYEGDIPGEEWRGCGPQGMYAVSNYGRVMTFKDRYYGSSEYNPLRIRHVLEQIDNIRSREHNYRPVKAIRVDTGEEVIFGSRKEASITLNIPDSYISNIIAGKSEKTREGGHFKTLLQNRLRRNNLWNI